MDIFDQEIGSPTVARRLLVWRPEVELGFMASQLRFPDRPDVSSTLGPLT